MVQSIFEERQSDEQAPSVAVPRVWIGFIFAAAYLVAEFAVVLLSDGEQLNALLLIIAIGGWFYWLYCVHRFHRILEEMSSARYPISTGQAVAGHIIPFYNFY